MPMFELTCPKGALTPDGRSQLVADLTAVLLRAERAPDTEFFRNITWGYVHELPTDAVLAGGRPATAPTFRLDVTTPEGGLSDRRREELVAETTRVVRDVAGIPEREAGRVWVLLHEIPEGSWGAAGRVVQYRQLLQLAQGEREKNQTDTA